MAAAIDLAKLGLRFQNEPFIVKPNPASKSTILTRAAHNLLSSQSFGRQNRAPRRLCTMCSMIDQQEKEQVVEEASDSGFTKEESSLIDALIGVQGRGRSASPKQLQDVERAVQVLEGVVGVPEPTSSSLIEGRWQLMFTTRPGTASAIQRTFVGVDSFTVYQEVYLRTNDPRVSNIVKFSDAVGELKVEGTTFVLQKETDSRQKLLSVMATGLNVKEAIEEFISLNQKVAETELELLEGEWKMIWSSQVETDSWIENAANGLMGNQIVRPNGNLKFLVDIFLGFKFSMTGTFVKSGTNTYDVTMDDGAIVIGPYGLPMEMETKTTLEIIYTDDKIRISRGYNRILFVHVRIDGSEQK
ncbi:probable plastid-lipid-associated protein 12, chloroplastic isoform X2 [Coffea eugenioides]|uniref:probable plastid-lipid-associated protein 12, chloroplastic isoform X2 n=1 Tax=Coffea eugenioides TaxID=49369 RepID=UPI000F612D9C|nr:probable plastid-lipid-associated protein 12, chloroplastic isoform X2 [Coffea eugenioides]